MIRRRSILGPALAGVALALAAHPDIARPLARAMGTEPRRALPLERLIELGLNHLLLAGIGLAIVAPLGIGLGVLATRGFAAPLRAGIDGAAAAAQAVPPVVMVALALPVLGFGGPPTVLALVAYGIMPMLRGTVGAIEAVSTDVRQAAIALGLSPRQVLLQVELPLAAGKILETLRTAMILAIATTAVGALAGASTLGTPIVAGLQNQNLVAMLQGAAATAALAFLCDAALLAAARLRRRREGSTGP